MKVLQINATYDIGSTGVIMADIGAALEASGGEAYYAYQSSDSEVKNGYRVGNVIDHKAHALLCRVFGAQGYYSCNATRKLIKHIKAVKPDVVLLHNLHSNFVNIDLLFKFLAKEDIRTIITMHDCWYFTGKCFHYADCGCDGFMHGCGNCKKKKAPPASMIFDWSAKVLENKKKRITAIPRLTLVGCSEWICGETKKSVLKDCETICIRNGVDTDIFKALGEKEQKPRLSVMGMANKWLLPQNIGIVQLLADSGEYDITVVGCSETQKQKLKEISNTINAVGYVYDKNELADYYRSADVFVNMTYIDNLPTVNMESLCCGTPVITFDSGGSPELIPDGCGFVIPQGDNDALISALGKIKTLDADISETAKNLFDKDKLYNEYIQLFKREIVK